MSVGKICKFFAVMDAFYVNGDSTKMKNGYVLCSFNEFFMPVTLEPLVIPQSPLKFVY